MSSATNPQSPIVQQAPPPVVIPQPAPRGRRPKSGLLVPISITTVVTAAIIGLFSYLWLSNALNSAVQERLKSLEERQGELKGIQSLEATFQERIKTLESRITDLKPLEAQLADLQKSTDEINPLRTFVTTLQIAAQKHEGDTTNQLNLINQQHAEIAKLRMDNEATCELIAKMRERVATLEAKAGAGK
jgi:hypothetical protein